MNRKPRKKVVQQENLVILPSAESLLADAFNIIQKELAKFSGKVNRGQSLDLKEARVFQGYIKSLTELSRESREASKGEDYSELSTEELMKLLGEKQSETKESENESESEKIQ